MKKSEFVISLGLAAFLAACGQSSPAPVGPTAPPTSTTVDCLPISAGTPQIAFSITNGSMGMGKITAGTVPGSAAVGSTALIAGQAPAVANAINFQGSRAMDGTNISLSISQSGVTANPQQPGIYPMPQNAYPSAINGTGTLTLSQMVISQLALSQNGMISPYGTIMPGAPGVVPAVQPTTNTTNCVSGVAVQLSHTINGNNWLYLGSVYLYLNRSAKGVAVDF